MMIVTVTHVYIYIFNLHCCAGIHSVAVDSVNCGLLLSALPSASEDESKYKVHLKARNHYDITRLSLTN